MATVAVVATAAVIESAADAMVSSRKLRRDDTISKQVEVTPCISCDDEEAGCDLQTAEFAKTR